MSTTQWEAGFDAGYESGVRAAGGHMKQMSAPEYFWSYEFRFDLREATRGEQAAVRVVFLAQRLSLDGFTERHVDLVETVLGHESEARRNVRRGHVAYDQEAATSREP